MVKKMDGGGLSEVRVMDGDGVTLTYTVMAVHEAAVHSEFRHPKFHFGLGPVLRHIESGSCGARTSLTANLELVRLFFLPQFLPFCARKFLELLPLLLSSYSIAPHVVGERSKRLHLPYHDGAIENYLGKNLPLFVISCTRSSVMNTLHEQSKSDHYHGDPNNSRITLRKPTNNISCV